MQMPAGHLESMRTESEPACSYWERSAVEQPRPRSRSAKWNIEDNTACYGQEKKLWVNIAICLVSFRPSVSHTAEASKLYERIKKNIL